jgi:hypothetical protein
MMMDYAIKALRDEFVDINSPYFVDEMADLERDEYRQSLKAVFGGHDDRFIALGQVFISLHLMELRGAMSSMSEKRMAMKSQAGMDPVYRPPGYATDEPRQWSTLEELEQSALLIDVDEE